MVAMCHFLWQNHGKLINALGSGASNPTPYQSAYASSNAWVRSFMLVLAKEYQESGVSVLAYNPGMMTTDLLTSVSVVEGYEDKLKVFPAIIRMWGEWTFGAYYAVLILNLATPFLDKIAPEVYGR